MSVDIEELHTVRGVGPVSIPAPTHHQAGSAVESEGGAAVATPGLAHGGHAVPGVAGQHQLAG